MDIQSPLKCDDLLYICAFAHNQSLCWECFFLLYLINSYLLFKITVHIAYQESSGTTSNAYYIWFPECASQDCWLQVTEIQNQLAETKQLLMAHDIGMVFVMDLSFRV